MSDADAGAGAGILSIVPDWSDWTALTDWLNSSLTAAARIADGNTTAITAVSGADLDSYQISNNPFGWYASPSWRRFAAATYAADLACYHTPADRVSWHRLLVVLAAYPRGFRVFFAGVPGRPPVPVGYTGYYAVAEETFRRLETAGADLADRMVPARAIAAPGDLLYLFNYSIAPPFHRSDAARTLMRTLAADIRALSPRGLAAITVSPDGIRVAERFGMNRSGTFTWDGSEEWIYTARFD